MRRHLTLLLVALCATLSLSAQPGNREIKAAAADAYAQKQGSYTPTFTHDGKKMDKDAFLAMKADWLSRIDRILTFNRDDIRDCGISGLYGSELEGMTYTEALEFLSGAQNGNLPR